MRSWTKMFPRVKQRDLNGNEEREKHLLKDQGKLVPCFLLHWNKISAWMQIDEIEYKTEIDLESNCAIIHMDNLIIMIFVN